MVKHVDVDARKNKIYIYIFHKFVSSVNMLIAFGRELKLKNYLVPSEWPYSYTRRRYNLDIILHHPNYIQLYN